MNKNQLNSMIFIYFILQKIYNFINLDRILVSQTSNNIQPGNLLSRMNSSNATIQPQQQQQQQQQPQQQQQHQNSVSSLQNNLTNKTNIPATTSSNSTPLINSISGINVNNMNNAVNNGLNPNAQAPQIQHQLIESFKLAVTSGLLNADLLNTRLPSEVLTMLYQMFQVQGQYINLNTKMETLSKRRSQLPPQQYKQEFDTLNQELQIHRDHLLKLKNNINNAHMILKNKMQPNFSEHNDQQLMQPLNQLNIKDQQLGGNSPLSALTPSGLAQNQQQPQPPRSLPKLINDVKATTIIPTV